MSEIRTLQSRVAAGKDPAEVCVGLGRTRKQARQALGYYGISWRDLLATGRIARKAAAVELYWRVRNLAGADGRSDANESALDAVSDAHGVRRGAIYTWLRQAGRPAQRPRVFSSAESLAMTNRHLNGETYAEIADSIGAPRSTVRTAIRRHRERVGLPETGDLRCRG